jgi:hypothetical protein
MGIGGGRCTAVWEMVTLQCGDGQGVGSSRGERPCFGSGPRVLRCYVELPLFAAKYTHYQQINALGFLVLYRCTHALVLVTFAICRHMASSSK